MRAQLRAEAGRRGLRAIVVTAAVVEVVDDDVVVSAARRPVVSFGS
jgi:hypothetical protein